MGYDPSLKKIIKTVEATRPKRLAEYKAGEHFERMTMEQRQDILEDAGASFLQRQQMWLGHVSQPNPVWLWAPNRPLGDGLPTVPAARRRGPAGIPARPVPPTRSARR